MPIILSRYESECVLHQGELYGGQIDVDVSWHTDPNEWYEVEAVASIDGGLTFPLLLGSAGRWGGISYAPVTGEPMIYMTVQAYRSQLIATDPIIKVIGGSSHDGRTLPKPLFAGLRAPPGGRQISAGVEEAAPAADS